MKYDKFILLSTLNFMVCGLYMMRNGSFVYTEINKIYLKFFIPSSWISHILCTLWRHGMHTKLMSQTNRVFINQNIVLQHRKHLLQKQTLKTKTNNTWWKYSYRICLFFFYLKIVVHTIISSEILYARKILIPNSRLSWFQQSSEYKRIKFLKVDHQPIITGKKRYL